MWIDVCKIKKLSYDMFYHESSYPTLDLIINEKISNEPTKLLSQEYLVDTTILVVKQDYLNINCMKEIII